MSGECFQLIDNEKFDNSILKRYFIKIYHQHSAQINDENQSIKYFFGENLNYIQIGHVCLEFEIRVKKAYNTNFIVAADITNEDVRLVKNSFAFTIHDARIPTTSDYELEQNNFV